MGSLPRDIVQTSPRNAMIFIAMTQKHFIGVWLVFSNQMGRSSLWFVKFQIVPSLFLLFV